MLKFALPILTSLPIFYSPAILQPSLTADSINQVQFHSRFDSSGFNNFYASTAIPMEVWTEKNMSGWTPGLGVGFLSQSTSKNAIISPNYFYTDMIAGHTTFIQNDSYQETGLRGYFESGLRFKKPLGTLKKYRKDDNYELLIRFGGGTFPGGSGLIEQKIPKVLLNVNSFINVPFAAYLPSTVGVNSQIFMRVNESTEPAFNIRYIWTPTPQPASLEFDYMKRVLTFGPALNYSITNNQIIRLSIEDSFIQSQFTSLAQAGWSAQLEYQLKLF